MENELSSISRRMALEAQVQIDHEANLVQEADLDPIDLDQKIHDQEEVTVDQFPDLDLAKFIYFSII